MSAFEDRESDVAKTHSDYTWAQDALYRPYISSTVTTLDPNTSNAISKQTTQTLDQFGNVTSMTQYDFPPSNVTRVYNNTYLTDAPGDHPGGSNYTAEHIYNRLLRSTVTSGGQITTLVHNLYDFYDAGTCGATRTPSGWTYVNNVTAIDPNTISNVFRGNVTTSYGLDMTHTCATGQQEPRSCA